MEFNDFHNFRDSRIAFYFFYNFRDSCMTINDFHDFHGCHKGF